MLDVEQLGNTAGFSLAEKIGDRVRAGRGGELGVGTASDLLTRAEAKGVTILMREDGGVVAGRGNGHV
jgi:hypothetical protein